MTNIANRDDLTGLITNIILSTTAAALVNTTIFLLGWDRTDTLMTPSFDPPGYVVAIVWLFLFALMGTARWLVIKSKSEQATYHSRIMVFLMAVCLLYPFYTLGLKIFPGFIGNIAIFLVTGLVANQIKSSSKTASALIVLVMMWVCFAIVITVRLIQLNG